MRRPWIRTTGEGTVFLYCLENAVSAERRSTWTARRQDVEDAAEIRAASLAL
jgi:hypothetical protein